MDAKELRIGNYVSNPPLSDFHKIDYLDIRDFAESRLIMPFEPIPLTEEWLLKFGFKKGSFEIMIYPIGAYNLCITEKSAFYNGVKFPCKSVHQLQNLYFALTGSELELKERGEKV